MGGQEQESRLAMDDVWMGLIAFTLLYIYLRMREARKQRMEEQARNDMQQAVADYIKRNR